MKRWLIRLAPFAILLISALALAWVRLVREADGQANFLLSVVIVGVAGILLFAWVLLLSGLRARTRVKLLVVTILLAALLVALLRIDGVSGDLVPIIRWRFSPRAEAILPGIPSPPRPPDPGVSTAGAGARLDYPQFLGPSRDATVKGARLARDWSRSPPRPLWRRKTGAGWSGFAVAGDAAFTQEQRGDLELVTCHALLTGDVRWSHSDPTRYETVIGGVGPRATPTVTEDRVYTLGGTGLLNCLERERGARRWARDVMKESGSDVNEWGMSGSPLVLGRLVIVSPGGTKDRSLAAYDRETGEPVWTGGTARAGYSSPLHAVIQGDSQVLILNRASVAGHDAATGKVLWERPWPGASPSAAQPLPLPGDRVLVSSGYGVGCALFQIEKGAEAGLHARELWKNRNLKAKFANFVHKDGFVYGLDDGILVCLDVETGERRWKGGRYGHGQMILVEDLLLVTAESGEVALIEPVPAGHRELGRFEALEGKTWNSPAFAAPYLLVRNAEDAACFELALE
ncbi:MAG TPA: PQQ-binding-like beta-propeller repeat protein [Planctomycetota bacterium]|nr:PQQ-binding-like beta-propeller repeat protein [Planctomycetota bacterium]